VGRDTFEFVAEPGGRSGMRLRTSKVTCFVCMGRCIFGASEIWSEVVEAQKVTDSPLPMGSSMEKGVLNKETGTWTSLRVVVWLCKKLFYEFTGAVLTVVFRKRRSFVLEWTAVLDACCGESGNT
jgi:hypothetical protein